MLAEPWRLPAAREARGNGLNVGRIPRVWVIYRLTLHIEEFTNAEPWGAELGRGRCAGRSCKICDTRGAGALGPSYSSSDYPTACLSVLS